MKFISALVACIAVASTASAAFSSCGKSTDDLTLTGITYTPNPPKVGSPVCVTLTGSLKKEVDAGASIHITASVFGINAYDQTQDLCNALIGSANPCPIYTNATSVTQCLSVPSNVPAGVSLNLKVVATNAGGSSLFCISGPLTFSK